MTGNRHRLDSVSRQGEGSANGPDETPHGGHSSRAGRDDEGQGARVTPSERADGARAVHARRLDVIHRRDDLDRHKLSSAHDHRGPIPAPCGARCVRSPIDAVSRHAVIVGGDAHERFLTALVLRDALPGARVTEAADAISFATAVAMDRLDVAVVARELHWADAFDVIALLHRRHPGSVVVLLGATVSNLTEPDAQPDAHLSPGAAGLARLGAVVLRALEPRARGGRSDSAASDMDAVPVALLRLSADERVMWANAAAVALLGHEETVSLAGRPLRDIVQPADATTGTALETGLAAAASAVPPGLEVRAQAVSGPPVSCRLVVRTETRDGALTGFVAALLTHAPAMAGGIGNLLFGISHDLQQPLTTTRQSAQMLSDRLAAQARLAADEERMLRRIVSGTERMEALMSGLIEYVRTGRTAMSVASFDLGETVTEVVRGMQATLDGAGAAVRWGNLPRIQGSRTDISRLIENLVANAVKFHGPGKPVVDISCEDRDDSWLLLVRDNGIGIPPDQAERIFEPFQRLHTDSEYPGTGIGLAICRQVCERHGGRIWVTPNPDRGSTFHITIPKALPHDSMG